MSAALVLAIANFAIMALVALAAPVTPRWIRASAWLLLAGAAVVLALHLGQDAWAIDGHVLAFAFLVSTCLNAGALAPLVMQAVMGGGVRRERSAD